MNWKNSLKILILFLTLGCYFTFSVLCCLQLLFFLLFFPFCLLVFSLVSFCPIHFLYASQLRCKKVLLIWPRPVNGFNFIVCYLPILGSFQTILWPVEFLYSFQVISGQSFHVSYRLPEVLTICAKKMYINRIISTQTLISIHATRVLHSQRDVHLWISSRQI